MSTEDEKRAGAEAARQVEQELGLVDNPALEQYVAQLGERLGARSPRTDVSYRFQIADMAETNAFALPGGYIYVSRGLLALANTEDELANVLAHEIGHVAARHHARQQARATGVGVLSALGTIAAAILGGPQVAQVVGQLGQVVGAGVIASYSREQEHEADEIGQALAARAGWNPEAMATFLKALEREAEVRSGGRKRSPSFLDSHPSTPERVARASARARTLTAAPADRIAATRDAYLQRARGIMLGVDPAQGVFDDGQFLHPDMDFKLRFPEDWQTQNTPSAVAALSPQSDALFALESGGPGDDPREAAERAVNQSSGIQVVRHGALRINSRPAYQVLATQEGNAMLVTWVAHGDQLFKFSALTSTQQFRGYQALFDRTLRSFQPLSSGDRARIKVRRLQVASARQGETLEQLGRRTGNAWSVAETAVFNGLSGGDPLRAGHSIKIAVEESYRSR
jgi:predicted Zn-dependent protease